jgi:8-oxo-dGTP pyrophosphatase MutT (NUDIX family)
LLLRIGYSHRSWVIPTGGVEKNETPKQAALRELAEESGIVIKDAEFLFKRNHEHFEGVQLYYYFAEIHDVDITIDTMEIVDGGWFHIDALPEPHRPKLKTEIELFKEWLETKAGRD